jgi:hypothetical protein
LRSKSLKIALAAAAVLVLLVVFAARNRDRRVEVFVGELDGTADEMVNTINASPTAAGVSKAHEILSAKKDGLKAKLSELRVLTAAQAGGASLTQVEEGLRRSSERINNFLKEELSRRQRELDELQKRAKDSGLTVDRYAVDKAQEENKQFREAMKKLLDDYKSIID